MGTTSSDEESYDWGEDARRALDKGVLRGSGWMGDGTCCEGQCNYDTCRCGEFCDGGK